MAVAGSMASILHVSPEALEILLRLAAATLVGTVLGLNRELKRKPTGARTLALVCLGAALVTVSAVHYPGMGGSADAMSRVLQGVIQGVMTGVGFIGAGVIIRGRRLWQQHRLGRPSRRRHHRQATKRGNARA